VSRPLHAAILESFRPQIAAGTRSRPYAQLRGPGASTREGRRRPFVGRRAVPGRKPTGLRVGWRSSARGRRGPSRPWRPRLSSGGREVLPARCRGAAHSRSAFRGKCAELYPSSEPHPAAAVSQRVLVPDPDRPQQTWLRSYTAGGWCATDPMAWSLHGVARAAGRARRSCWSASARGGIDGARHGGRGGRAPAPVSAAANAALDAGPRRHAAGPLSGGRAGAGRGEVRMRPRTPAERRTRRSAAGARWAFNRWVSRAPPGGAARGEWPGRRARDSRREGAMGRASVRRRHHVGASRHLAVRFIVSAMQRSIRRTWRAGAGRARRQVPDLQACLAGAPPHGSAVIKESSGRRRCCRPRHTSYAASVRACGSAIGWWGS